MPRKKKQRRRSILNYQERKKILDMKEKGWKPAKISRTLQLKPSTVNNVIYRRKKATKRQKCMPKKSGRPNKLKESDSRRIIDTVAVLQARNIKVTAKKVIDATKLNISVSLMRKELIRLGLKYLPLSRKIVLNQSHVTGRLEFCKYYFENQVDFKKIIFTDEKKFKYDGPDNQQCWQFPGNRVPNNRRRQGGLGIMMLGMIGFDGLFQLIEVNGGQNSEKYREMLESKVLGTLNARYGQEYVFQQDNASIHVSKAMKQFFIDKNIDLLPWPARSPDLNIIENVWAELCRYIYDGKPINSLLELRNRIQEASVHINTEYIQKLYASFNTRVSDCLKAGGNIIRS